MICTLVMYYFCVYKPSDRYVYHSLGFFFELFSHYYTHHCNAKILWVNCSHHQNGSQKSIGKINFLERHTTSTVVTYGKYSHNVYNRLPAVFSLLERKPVRMFATVADRTVVTSSWPPCTCALHRCSLRLHTKNYENNAKVI